MDTDTARTSAPSLTRRRSLLLLGAVGLAGLAGVIAFQGPPSQPAPESAPKGLVLNDTPKPIPDLRFTDGDGQLHTLADFRGKVVLLNVWATWCLPCRKEMPTLDRLQAALGGDRFQVVTLSVDRQGAAAVKAFFSEIGVRRLAVHVDVSGQALSALAAVGLPTTLLIDEEGRELGRLMGPAKWEAPDMIAFLMSIVEGKAEGVAASMNKGSSR
ncbi:thiol-disulfide isomerase/thioredoxin [Sinorhizobium kostiense]|uniref:Thiol-disulfide isomerase/thioredoxin n=2 Tax=Sinorhizobium kostiense TaxID=76747 RepID=A0ABS4R7X7_9HYPH|nr:thiol-disulfide isomerase/thioredoxin [Sinorhizobium kostiense]